MNISRSTGIQRLYATLLCTLNTIAALLAVSLASWLIGLTIVRERASDDQRLGSLDNTVFVAKLSRVTKLTTMRSQLLGDKFVLLP